MSNSESVEQIAVAILQALISKPFEECHSVGREFTALTTCHSIYAVRHRVEGLLYIGKAQNPRLRFTGGHLVD